MSETEAVEELEKALFQIRTAKLDAEWCWDTLGNEDYYVWKIMNEEEVVEEFENILNEMVRAQKDYDREVRRVPQIMQQVAEVLDNV
jgi:hypothetical protein